MGANPHRRSNAAERIERQVRCYELKLLGHSLRAISEILTAEGTPISHETVRVLIKDEGDSRVLPLQDEVRKQEIDRFDSWLLALSEQISSGNQVARSIEVAVKVSERRAKLLGVDSPAQAEISGTFDHKPSELLERLARARQQVAEDEHLLRQPPTTPETDRPS